MRTSASVTPDVNQDLASRPAARTFSGALFLLIVCLSFLVLALTPARAAEVITAGEGELSLEIQEGQLVRLDRAASSVFIADPEIADVQVQSPRLVYIYGQRAGSTTLFAVDQNDQIIASERVIVRHNLRDLDAAIRRYDPALDVTLDSMRGGLVLSGRVESPSQAEDVRQLAERFVGDSEDVINRLRVSGSTQINLRVRVAEVSRQMIKRFGVNWSNALSAGNFTFGLAGGSPSGLEGAFGLSGGFQSGSADLNVLVDALAEEGMLSILAEPNLTTTSGEEASFLAGGEFPIPIPSSDDTVTIEYKQFGVSLVFTPTLLDGNRISLKVQPEVSELSIGDGVRISGFDIPALTTRRADTRVELASGQSFAIAGLLESTSSQDVQRLPGLGDLPVLGALFRSESYRRGETELAIVVTPYVVRPSAGPMALPTDGMTPPSDAERLLLGRNQGAGPPVGRGGGLHGPVGFILD